MYIEVLRHYSATTPRNGWGSRSRSGASAMAEDRDDTTNGTRE